MDNGMNEWKNSRMNNGMIGCVNEMLAWSNDSAMRRLNEWVYECIKVCTNEWLNQKYIWDRYVEWAELWEYDSFGWQLVS